MNVTKLELCKRIARKLGYKQVQDVKPIIETFLDEVLQVLSENQRIEIRGFGVFSVKNRKPRIGRNPRTGEIVNIAQYKAPHFKFSKEAQNNFETKLNKLQ
ncbi:integration host factor subunit beta [candidate division KSB1 bacterium]|nr:MAG: integration host factor subunit beta [candidate division KSB1 bacterium]